MSRKKNNGNRKNKPSRVNYKATRRWLINKVRKLEKHMRNYVNDVQAQSALDRTKAKI